MFVSALLKQRPPNGGHFSFWVFFALQFAGMKRQKQKHRTCKCNVFVRDKNTQKLETTYLIQNFPPVTNIHSFLKSVQRFKIYFNFSPSSRILYWHYLFLIWLFSIVGNFVKNHATKVRCFCFHLLHRFCFYLFFNRLLRSNSHSKRKMEAIWRPLEEFKNWFHNQT